jgi:toxin ParE1/3/4
MPEIRKVIWAPETHKDLHDIWRYYAKIASREIANRIISDITQTGVRLAEHPLLLGRPRDDLQPGLRSTRVHPYLIFYRVTPSAIEIVRVLHGSRNLPVALQKSDDD